MIREALIAKATPITSLFLAVAVMLISTTILCTLGYRVETAISLSSSLAGFCFIWSVFKGSGAEGAFRYFFIRPQDTVAFETPEGLFLGVVENIPQEIKKPATDEVLYSEKFLRGNHFVMVVSEKKQLLVQSRYIFKVGGRHGA